jgi:transposase InsO family protein
MSIITEGMRYRKRIIEYAIKHNNNAKAARRYNTSRQNVSRWRQLYDGTIESLRKKSRRPHSHPNQHTEEELELIRHNYRYHSHRGLAHVYRKCMDSGYSRSYESMCRKIRQMGLNAPKKKKVHYKKKKKKVNVAEYPGEKVQIDVKYVPNSCIGFSSYHSQYYQITAIDVYSRKRVIELVRENSTYTTSEFAKKLEKRMGFSIKQIQTDNGKEFCNDPDQTEKKSRFEKELEKLKIEYIRTAPYSPWQNAYVERSHREDEERFYQKRRFSSEEEMYKSHKRYETIINSTYRRILEFRSSNEVVEEYFRKAAQKLYFSSCFNQGTLRSKALDKIFEEKIEKDSSF